MKKPVPAAVAVTALMVASALSAASSERMEDGKRAYELICARCHQAGVDGAPVVGQKDDWADRSHLWQAVLTRHAEKGYLKMPARGDATHATDYDVGAAAEYMLTITHPEMTAD
ncbi:c-type cytochrome [Seongchinamella sediminis]|nr:c-type cytochrome [Seongchinamella sediminis]